MTLASRIVALVAFALIPALAIQGYNEYALRSAREASVRRDALAAARAAANDLDQLGDSVRQILGLISLEPALVTQDPVACSAFLGKANGFLPGSVLLAVTRTDGAVICNSVGSTPGTYSNAERAYHRRALATGAFSVGSFAKGWVTERNSLHFAQPLRDGTGTIVAIVLASIDLGWLAERLAMQESRADTALSVIDEDGVILARVPDHAAWVGRHIAPDRLQEIAANVGRARDATAWDGRRRIVGIVHPKGALALLTVSVGRDREAVFADIDAATKRGVILIVLGGVLALAGAIVGGRMFVREPMERLLEAARAWRMGELGTRTRLFGRSDFGRLGEAFDAMASSLQRHDDELKAEIGRSRVLQEQQAVMLHELNHRVKNTLATVQSLVRQSSGSGSGSQGEKLEGRIVALSKTHDLLTRDEWTGASLREVLENEFVPYRAETDRLVLDGADIELPPRYVLSLGMTFHELTTNAAKYGALSNADGRVSVRWDAITTEAGARRLRLEWQETGGPAVTPPGRRGFGTRLVMGIGRELAGEVQLDFAPDGLCVRIDVPVVPQGALAMLDPTAGGFAAARPRA